MADISSAINKFHSFVASSANLSVSDIESCDSNDELWGSPAISKKNASLSRGNLRSNSPFAKYSAQLAASNSSPVLSPAQIFRKRRALSVQVKDKNSPPSPVFNASSSRNKSYKTTSESLNGGGKENLIVKTKPPSAWKEMPTMADALAAANASEFTRATRRALLGRAGRSCRGAVSPVRVSLRVSDYLGLSEQIEGICAELIADYAKALPPSQLMTALNQVTAALQRIVCDMGFSTKTANAVAKQVPRHTVWDKVAGGEIASAWRRSPGVTSDRAKNKASFSASQIGFQPSAMDRVRASLARSAVPEFQIEVRDDEDSQSCSSLPQSPLSSPKQSVKENVANEEEKKKKKSWFWRKIASYKKRRKEKLEREAAAYEAAKAAAERRRINEIERRKLEEEASAAHQNANAIAIAALAAARRRLEDLDDMMSNGTLSDDDSEDSDDSFAVEVRVKELLAQEKTYPPEIKSLVGSPRRWFPTTPLTPRRNRRIRSISFDSGISDTHQAKRSVDRQLESYPKELRALFAREQRSGSWSPLHRGRQLSFSDTGPKKRSRESSFSSAISSDALHLSPSSTPMMGGKITVRTHNNGGGVVVRKLGKSKVAFGTHYKLPDSDLEFEKNQTNQTNEM
eukprot:g2080.t1